MIYAVRLWYRRREFALPQLSARGRSQLRRGAPVGKPLNRPNHKSFSLTVLNPHKQIADIPNLHNIFLNLMNKVYFTHIINTHKQYFTFKTT